MSNFTNRLINEKSPYLLQHANNPVDWFPWCDEAFQKAKKENKLIFLSIGYSTCHWCHVMEKESFIDYEIAGLLNQNFISIKVDREERPDVDHFFMNACQILTGRGGWPLSIFMTPDKKPFYAGTYFPKENRYGSIGFRDLLINLNLLWKEKSSEIINSAQEISEYLNKSNVANNTEKLDENVLHIAYNYFKENFDDEFGGFGNAPKFPSPHNLMFLLRYWKKYNKADALNMVVNTLSAMSRGGIFDQIGFGFHRYSTDKKWLVPHFEKMLYDQALLIIAYTEAYQASGNIELKETVFKIIDYVFKYLKSPEGGFYTAEDADSEGEEGKFYFWNIDEIISVLGQKDADLFIDVFNINESGNFDNEITGQKNGNNIPNLSTSLKELANKYGLDSNELNIFFDKCRSTLLKHRDKRIRPLRDEKILTDWNGLMIAALAIAGRVFNDKNFIFSAEQCLNFIKSNLSAKDGTLLHRYCNGESKFHGNLDDYSFLIWGLLELYRSTFNEEYLLSAKEYIDKAINIFHDNISGGFYFSSQDETDLSTRSKIFYDSAIPSGNSIMLHNLITISRITAEPAYEEYANKLLNNISASINKYPQAFTSSLSSLLFLLDKTSEFVIVGDLKDKNTAKIIKEFNRQLITNAVIIFKDTNKKSFIDFLNTFEQIDNKTTYYICRNHTCNLPTTDFKKAISILSNNI
jgi:hypothetical protein